MLSFTDRHCDRRSFLRIGSLSMAGGLGLPQMLAAQSLSPELVRDKAVVFVFMHGGPPQTETFDPKMDAPDGVRSVLGEVKTPIPGVTFGGGLPKLAKLAKKLAVVRSFSTGDGAHDIKPIVSKGTTGANLGSLYSRIAGLNHGTSGLPRNVALYPQAVVPAAQPANLSFGDFSASGSLGKAYAPFVAGGNGDAQRDMQLRLPRNRVGDRQQLLRQLEGLRRNLDSSGAMAGVGELQQQAFDVIFGAAAEAFDLSKEDPRTLARYDTSKLYDTSKIDRRWNNHKNYRDHANSLGHLMLMARRLCERGCGFVTVTTNFVWDFHADKNNATVQEGMGYVGAPFDHAVSAFIEDIHARGLEEKILLVCCGEMGRTPRINARGGRDHWGRLAPLMLSGGGLNMGQVIGSSTSDAGEPASGAVGLDRLVATVMHSLLDIPKLRTASGIPADTLRALTSAEPIPGLF